MLLMVVPEKLAEIEKLIFQDWAKADDAAKLVTL